MTSIEIRVLSPISIEDYHAHLLRLDRAERRLRFAEDGDDRGIDGHCLRLLGGQAIVIGGYLDGVLRVGVEICPDRTARRAEAIFTAEPEFPLGSAIRMLLTRLMDEAHRYHLTEMKLYGVDRLTEIERAAAPNNVQVIAGAPVVLRFDPDPAGMPAPVKPAHAAYA
jgi:hypothetical protein